MKTIKIRGGGDGVSINFKNTCIQQVLALLSRNLPMQSRTSVLKKTTVIWSVILAQQQSLSIRKQIKSKK
ncbi:hypothetical protein DOY81_006495, partial [Sarcophaga bullata]